MKRTASPEPDRRVRRAPDEPHYDSLLPDETWLLVFGNFSLTDIVRAAQVSTRWRALARDPRTLTLVFDRMPLSAHYLPAARRIATKLSSYALTDKQQGRPALLSNVISALRGDARAASPPPPPPMSVGWADQLLQAIGARYLHVTLHHCTDDYCRPVERAYRYLGAHVAESAEKLGMCALTTTLWYTIALISGHCVRVRNLARSKIDDGLTHATQFRDLFYAGAPKSWYVMLVRTALSTAQLTAGRAFMRRGLTDGVFTDMDVLRYAPCLSGALTVRALRSVESATLAPALVNSVLLSCVHRKWKPVQAVLDGFTVADPNGAPFERALTSMSFSKRNLKSLVLLLFDARFDVGRNAEALCAQIRFADYQPQYQHALLAYFVVYDHSAPAAVFMRTYCHARVQELLAFEWCDEHRRRITKIRKFAGKLVTSRQK